MQTTIPPPSVVSFSETDWIALAEAQFIGDSEAIAKCLKAFSGRGQITAEEGASIISAANQGSVQRTLRLQAV